MFRILGVALLAATLSACAASSAMTGDYAKGSGKTLIVSKKVWAGFQNYASKVSVSNPGGFAVEVVDGIALGYAGYYCSEGHCFGGSASVAAMKSCREAGPGIDCVLFAHSSEILVNYRVEDQ
jgi:hypothetical protein